MVNCEVETLFHLPSSVHLADYQRMGSYSYSSASVGVRNRIREALQLVRIARRPPESAVDWTIGLYENTKERIREQAGVTLSGLRGLEIGPGQQLGSLRCFSLENDMVAIDTDVIAAEASPLTYVRMVRHNSFLRTAKTIARKALGVDRRFRKTLLRRLGAPAFPTTPVLRMSATEMTFPQESFDFVYSHSVFEHIDDPAAALAEIERVLRPGGVAYVSVHLYTSHAGSHDPKLLADGIPVPPLWPHLRPAFAHTVHPNTYLNRLTLAEWRDLFEAAFPGVTYVADRQDEELGDALRELRAAGELTEYTDEELLTVNLIAIWRKPDGAEETAPRESGISMPRPSAEPDVGPQRRRASA